MNPLHIHPVGRKPLRVLFSLLIPGIALNFFIHTALGILIPLILFVMILLLLFFLRDPNRVSPNSPNCILSPADGTIVQIWENRESPEGYSMSGLAIFLSLFDVHFNRSPVQGKLLKKKYYPGKFHPAFLQKASDCNEQNHIKMESPKGIIWIKQIAGLLTRRILCFCEIGATLFQGERIGLIFLGSRVEIYVPQSIQWHVKVGQHVRAGETILAEWKDNA